MEIFVRATLFASFSSFYVCVFHRTVAALRTSVILCELLAVKRREVGFITMQCDGIVLERGDPGGRHPGA